MQNQNKGETAAAVPSRGGFHYKEIARETGLWVGLAIFIYFLFHYAVGA